MGNLFKHIVDNVFTYNVWKTIIIIFILTWMLYIGWVGYTIIARSLWMTVSMTYICQPDGKICDWKWPTKTLGK